MTEQEKAFWLWWNYYSLDDEENYAHWNLRMAFDAGYEAATNGGKS